MTIGAKINYFVLFTLILSLMKQFWIKRRSQVKVCIVTIFLRFSLHHILRVTILFDSSQTSPPHMSESITKKNNLHSRMRAQMLDSCQVKLSLAKYGTNSARILEYKEVIFIILGDAWGFLSFFLQIFFYNFNYIFYKKKFNLLIIFLCFYWYYFYKNDIILL
jgi:hypothetical protein